MPSPAVNLGLDTTVCEGEEFWIELDNGGASFLWNDQLKSSSRVISSPELYWVDVIFDGCTTRDSIKVDWEDCSSRLEMPNVFTPNGEGSNDYFKPFNLENAVNFELLIYNRWRGLLYEGSSLEGWNGEYNNQPLSDGVYFWIVNYSGFNNQNKLLKGDVTLIR